MKKKSKQVSIRLTVETIERLKKIATEQNRDRSKQIVYYIDKGLQAEGKK